MKAKPQYKTAMRLGASVFPKTMSQKFAIRQEKKAKSKPRGRGMTEYGKQLLEKQKIKATYGITEKQFRKYVDEAMRAKDMNPAAKLHERLERRLDNVIFRLNLAPSRRAARQMVSHGHVVVNGKKTTIPSQNMSLSDTLVIREGSRSRAYFTNLADKFAETALPSWLTFDLKSMRGALTELPTRENADPAGDLGAVLSFYSR